jgi:hypothetical protein
LVLPAAFLLLRWATPRGTLRTLGGVGPATLADLLIAAVTALAWVALCWLAAVTGLAAVATTTGRLGALGEAALRHLAPVAVRRVLAVTLSAGVAVGPALPAAATPAGGAAPSAPVTRAVDPLDRPVHADATSTAVGASAPTAPTPASPTSASPNPASPTPASPSATAAARTAGAPAWTPDRPARPVRRAATTDVRLVTCWPERPLVEDVVVVRRGDSLWHVAARALGAGASDAEVAEAWPRWYAANRAVIGADPSVLEPGQVLRPPARHDACDPLATGRAVPDQPTREDNP